MGKKLLLIVDDDSLIVDTLKMYMDDAYEVKTFGGRKCFYAAQEYIEKKGRIPDVALVDLALGNGSTGIDLGNMLKKVGVKKVVFFSGCHEVDSLIVEAKKIGDKIIEKPARYSEIKESLDG